jgi:hypothetical protein
LSRGTTKQDEAELADSEKHKAVAHARELLAYLEEWETELWEEEKKVWQPHWSRDDPLRDRMLRIGMSPEQVAEFERRLAATKDIILGKSIPADIQKELDDVEAAENSALQQLSNIVGSR